MFQQQCPAGAQHLGTVGRAFNLSDREAQIFGWQLKESAQTLSMTVTGAGMSTIIFWLALVWMPGLAFFGYLLIPKRPETD